MSKVLALLLVLATPIAARAQEADGKSDDAAQPPSQGPMTIERVHNGFAVAPDFKITKMNGSTGRLAGGYAGWIFDDALLVGGGVYGLTNNPKGLRDMWYGGAVVQWLQWPDRAISLAARGLVGCGSATFTNTVVVPGPLPFDRFNDLDALHALQFANRTFTVHQRRDFFVAEPQGDVLVRLSRHFRIDAGVGYR